MGPFFHTHFKIRSFWEEPKQQHQQPSSSLFPRKLMVVKLGKMDALADV